MGIWHVGTTATNSGMAEDECHTGQNEGGAHRAKVLQAELQDKRAGLSRVSHLPSVSITCIGHLRIRLGTEPVDLRSKARELLAYLATRPFLCAGHDALLDALWPERDPARAERLLYNAVWKVRGCLDTARTPDDGPWGRRGLGPRRAVHAWRDRGGTASASVLLTERGFYSLNSARCQIDVTGLLDQVARTEAAIQDGRRDDTAATWLALAQTQPDPKRLLIGEPFEWLPAFQDELRDSHEQMLTRALACADRADDTVAALDALHRLLALNPLQEDVVARAMDLHLARGEAAAAARCYRSFRTALQRDYGMAEGTGGDTGEDIALPSCELRVLYARATARADTSGGAPRALGPPGT